MPDTVGRWALRVPEDGDNPDIPQDFLNLATDLSNVAMDDQGTLAARPVSTVLSPSNKPGRYWYVTGDGDAAQNGRLWRDTGAGWVEVTMNRRPVLTALPGSPTTGDEILFQSAGMVTAGVGPWHLRYDSALSGLFKWAVISAAPWAVNVEAGVTLGLSASFADLSDGLPTILLPAAGDYVVDWGASITTGGTAPTSSSVAPAATGHAASEDITFWNTAANTSASVSRRLRLDGISGTLKLQGKSSNATATAARRSLAATPVRLG